jgi:hypothetical protein
MLRWVQAGHLVTYMSEMAADGLQAGWLNDWSLRSQVGIRVPRFLPHQAEPAGPPAAAAAAAAA